MRVQNINNQYNNNQKPSFGMMYKIPVDLDTKAKNVAPAITWLTETKGYNYLGEILNPLNLSLRVLSHEQYKAFWDIVERKGAQNTLCDSEINGKVGKKLGEIFELKRNSEEQQIYKSESEIAKELGLIDLIEGEIENANDLPLKRIKWMARKEDKNNKKIENIWERKTLIDKFLSIFGINLPN